MPKISVIVPVYKVEQYLERCVDSILGQTFTDFELILVDDGSPDGCPAICDAYAEKDSRVVVIHKKNGGVSSARNAGLDVAAGEYIYFVDSDDWIADNLLETVLPYLDKYDMVRFSYYIASDSITKPIIYRDSGELFLHSESERASFLVKKLLTASFVWEVYAGIYRRAMIETYHVRFPEGQNFAEDRYFTLCYGSHVRNVIILNECLYYYYQREMSIMATQAFAINADKMNILSKGILKYFEDRNVPPLFFEIFPVIHYLFFRTELQRYMDNTNCGISDIRKMLINDIEDFDYFAKWMLQLKQCREWLALLYPRKIILKFEISCMEYYATGKVDILFKASCIKGCLKSGVKAGQIIRRMGLR